VVLVLHGGPGNPMSPYAHNIYAAWEKDFTLVQWDQRGASRTFGRNPASAESALTIERMTQDGVELAAYLTRYLKTK
jgi:predicted alpha/beta-fold hydrolase